MSLNLKHGKVHPIEPNEDKPKIFTCSKDNLCKAEEEIYSKPTSFDYVDFSTLPVYKALMPILFSLRIAGFYYVRNEATVKFDIATLLFKIYCIIVMLIIWTGLVLNCTSLYVIADTPTLLYMITTVLQFGLGVAKVTCFFKASYDKKALRKFIVCMTALTGNDNKVLQWMRKVAIICCVICWLLLISSMTLILYVMFGLGLLILNATNHVATQIFTLLNAVYFTASFFFFDCLELLIGIMVRKQMLLLSCSIRENTENNGNFRGSLEKKRRKFLEIIQCIKAADKFLSFHHAASLGFNVANVCILIFIISYYPRFANNDFVRSFMVFDLLMCFIDMSLVCISGILITNGVSKI